VPFGVDAQLPRCNAKAASHSARGISMNEQALRELIAAVKARRVSRRTFIRRMVGLGLTAPFATELLASVGLAQSPAPVDYKPIHAGGGGALRTLFWQAPTSLNPHFAVGAKDVEGAGILRAARFLKSRREPRPDARRRNSRHRERWGRC
jgi:hypothetical protein